MASFMQMIPTRSVTPSEVNKILEVDDPKTGELQWEKNH